MQAKTVIFSQPDQIKIAEIDVPTPGPGQILTRTVCSGVSTGTEIRVLKGGEESAQFPLIPGYENVGEIIEVGKDVNFKPGTLVYNFGSDFTGQFSRCWGAHVEYALLSANNVIEVPSGVNPMDALYTSVGAIALHGIKRGKVAPNDKVAVVGLGLIGHLAVQCAKAYGARVIAVDMDKNRLAAAQKAGAEQIVNAAQENVEQRVKELTNGGVDVAIDVTGIASVVDTTARLICTQPWQPPYPPNGRVVLLGSYSEPIQFHYHPTLFENEPDIFPSRYATFDDKKEVMSLIYQQKLQPKLIPAKVFSFLDAAKAYQELLEQKLMRVIFSWTSS